MNEDLLQLIKDYTTKEHTEISVSLLGKSKDNLVSMLLDLLTTYYNDLNSSTMRELVVALLAGYHPSLEKLGYNGFRQNTLTGTIQHCEIKPKNYLIDSTAKKPGKLNGGGNFSDYTWERFRKHQVENPNMLVAGFVDGQLIYIFEFSFNEQSFISLLREKLERDLPDGDKPRRYVRSAEFSLKHYKGAKSLKTIYTAPKGVFIKSRDYLTKPLFDYLENTAP